MPTPARSRFSTGRSMVVKGGRSFHPTAGVSYRQRRIDGRYPLFWEDLPIAARKEVCPLPCPMPAHKSPSLLETCPQSHSTAWHLIYLALRGFLFPECTPDEPHRAFRTRHHMFGLETLF